MKEEKFRVIQFIRELILKVDKELENFPKKELEIKTRIRSNSYDLLEIVYEANSTTNIEKKKELLFRVISKVKVIDFLLNLSFDKKLINQKKYYKFGESIEDIVKYTSGWIKSII